MINLVLNKMEETVQSNTLDWSSLVFLLSLPLGPFHYNFVNSWPIYVKFLQYHDSH